MLAKSTNQTIVRQVKKVKRFTEMLLDKPRLA